MKKFLAVICTIAMVLSLSVAAFADIEMTFEDFDTDLYDEDSGKWVQFAETFEFLRPDWMEPYELTDEMIENDIVYFASDEDGEYFVIVTYYDEDDISGMLNKKTTAEDIIGYLAEVGYEADFLICNDIGTVSYYDAENDIYCIWIPFNTKNLFTISFTPASDDVYIEYVNNMIATISLVEE